MKTRMSGAAALVMLIALAGGAPAEQNQTPAGPAKPALSTKIDPARQAAWEAADAQAAQRVNDFDAAVKAGDADRIRRTALDLGSDPIAVQKLNRGRPDLVDAHTQVNDAIRAQTRQNIRENMASTWNASHPPDQQIKPENVEIYEPTNYRDPNAKPKSPQDWDVTLRVNGRDVPPPDAQGIVDKSYYDAAGGTKTFGEGTTPAQAARRQSIETTHRGSLEAYNEPDKVIGRPGEPPDPGSPLKDPDQLTHAIEHKSVKAAERAGEARAAGDEIGGVQQDFEQMRQASKQYDGITKPRVEAAGGKVNQHVENGMDILREVVDGKISPEEARARLADMGETPESMINKAAGQAEAAQKLKPPPKPSSPDEGGGPRRVAADTPDDTPPATTDSPDGKPPATADTPDGQPRATGDAPEGRSPMNADAPDGPPRTTADAPDGVPARAPADTPDGAPRATNVDAPDAPARGTVDTPDGAPRGPSVDGPDGQPRVTTDTPEGAPPGKFHDVIDKVGKGMQAIDILSNAEDFKKAAKEGDVGGMAHALVNTADGAVGGPIATLGILKDRGQRGIETAETLLAAQRRAEEANELAMRLDLRKNGYTKEQVDAIMRARAAGDGGPLDAAYEKLGKDKPTPMDVAITKEEMDGIYLREVGDNVVEVAAGIKDKTIKAGRFVKEAGEDVGEIAGGLADGDTRREVIDQVADNVSIGNLRDGLDAWGTNRKADQDREGARQTMEDRLVERGIPRDDARRAADAWNEGDRAELAALLDLIRQNRKPPPAAGGAESGDASAGPEPADTIAPSDGLKGEPEAGEPGTTDDASPGGGLTSFLSGRSDRTDANGRDTFGLMTGQQNLSDASTRGDQADRDARNLLNNAGQEAQNTAQRSSAETADGDRANSWGNAIGNGVQQGVEKGVNAAGETFAHIAADHASAAIFGGPKSGGHPPEDGGGTGNAGTAGGTSTGGGQTAAGTGGSTVRSGTRHGDAGDRHSGGTATTRHGSGAATAVQHGGGGSGTRRGGHPASATATAVLTGSGGKIVSVGTTPHGQTLTCPGCGKTFVVYTGGPHMCPYCVTMSCPKCGFTKNYLRGTEPSGCPACAARARGGAKGGTGGGGGGISGAW